MIKIIAGGKIYSIEDLKKLKKFKPSEGKDLKITPAIIDFKIPYIIKSDKIQFLVMPCEKGFYFKRKINKITQNLNSNKSNLVLIGTEIHVGKILVDNKSEDYIIKE